VADDIERGTETPVYAQLAAIIRRQIISGEIPPRGRVPSKTTLKQRYGVADVTVLKAIGLLKQDGLVISVHGLGVFVTSPERWQER
jgi:GntR family transcriptional regulator